MATCQFRVYKDPAPYENPFAHEHCSGEAQFHVTVHGIDKVVCDKHVAVYVHNEVYTIEELASANTNR